MDEKLYLEVNGMQQGMFLQGVAADKPVLLFLHGGPGSPEALFEQEFPTGLDSLFTVCWWEQRGSGLSYSKDIASETMTIGQMVDDAFVVVDYLRARFAQEKIYVMGHSWGSLLGVLLAQTSPERFHAYIGIGQVARQPESERLAYRYMLQEFRATGNKRMVRKLEERPIDRGAPIDFEYLGVRSQAMTKLGVGIMRRWTSELAPVKPFLRFKGYTWKDKVHFLLGGAFSINCLWEDVLDIDLFALATRFEIPVYVFQGLYDYQVSYALAKEYVHAIAAPVKGFYTFAESAHSPCFEEPEKMCRILREDVLADKAELAD